MDMIAKATEEGFWYETLDRSSFGSRCCSREDWCEWGNFVWHAIDKFQSVVITSQRPGPNEIWPTHRAPSEEQAAKRFFHKQAAYQWSKVFESTNEAVSFLSAKYPKKKKLIWPILKM